MEVWFYHLQSQPLARALPALVEKAVGRGWRVIVQTVDEARLKALDDLLWTYAAESFLPHATSTDKGAGRQPVLLTTGPENPNAAALRMYVEGAEVDLDRTSASYKRVLLVFDGRDDDELAAARRQWSRLKSDGFALAYWQQSDEGRWERKM
jgi:DNA polymerase-3 subunit chi